MALSPEEKADIAFLALHGEKPLSILAEERKVELWRVVDWAISLRQKGHRAFSRVAEDAMPQKGVLDGLPWRTVFIHIQKTAGTTLTSYLEDAYQYERICPQRLHNQLEDLALKRSLNSFDLFCGHFFYGWLQENAAFSGDTRYVTMLRDPVKRAISCYHHWMREPIRTYRYVSPLITDSNVQCMYLSSLPMRAAQYSMRDHLTSAKEVLESFFFVGIQERFFDSLVLLHKLMGTDLPTEQRILNTAEGQSLAQLPAALVEEIANANWADIELYEFAKTLFERRFQIAGDAPIERIAFANVAPLPSSINFKVTDPLNGRNWHEREGLDQQHQWRWSGPGTESILNFKLEIDRNAEYRVLVHVINAMTPEILLSMRVFVNGVEIQLVQMRDAENRFYWEGGVLGMEIASQSGDVQVRMQVSSTLAHFDLDSTIDDKRRCGFALSEFHLSVA